VRAIFTFAIAALASLTFAACGSNGARPFMPGAPGASGSDVSTDAVTKVTVKITVAPGSSAPDERRQPRYFSRGSKGLLVQAYADGKTKVAGQFAVNIAPGSKACGGSKSFPRTCQATLMLPATIARADFNVSDFNVKPVNGKIPKTAHLLAFGRLVNKKVSAKKPNAFSVYLGGVVSSLTGNAGFVSLPGDGDAHSLAVMIDPIDFGNNPVTGGAKDPFANPIVVSVTETGGSGHAVLSLNGGVGASSVTVSRSSDTVVLDYDGFGSIGYGARVTLTAPAFKRAAGATESIVVSPLLLGSSSADYTPGLLALKGNGEYQTVSAGEFAAPASTAYSLTTSNCSAIESTMPLVQSSAASARFAVITRGTIATPDPAGCVLAVSDGTSTVDVRVSNTYSGSLGSAPTIATTPFPTGSADPIEITVGPDGAMWFAEHAAGKIGRIAAGPIGASGAIAEYPLPATSGSPQPLGLTAGPDGRLWFTDCTNATIGNLTTAGVVTTIPIPNSTSEPSFIAAGSDGAMWFSFFNDTRIGTVATSTGAVPAYHTVSSASVETMALGADGNMWFTEAAVNKIGKMTPAGVLSEFPVPHASAVLWGITAGPDGALWFTECQGGPSNTGAIARIPTNATPGSGAQIQEFSKDMTGSAPVDITTGPDGALWFPYWNTAKIGRITTAGTITEYAIPGASAVPNAWGIASGPDGAIWFGDVVDNRLGRIAIATSTAARHSPTKR
jgi:virginiamycin B lyase